MRYLILSDIHANLVALEAVLADAPGFDAIWCLGDVVGYGPDPNECVERIQDFDHFCLAGNHDWAALGKLDLDTFNTDARIANRWTQSVLTPAAREYLNGLPSRADRDGFCLVHASPREPVWEYILDAHVACANFSHFDAAVCLVGHTHIPVVFKLNGRNRCGASMASLEVPVTLGPQRLIINPGSVGQPRDGDPRSSYALLDTDAGSLDYHRVPYAVQITQERMRARGLPRRLVERLAAGR